MSLVCVGVITCSCAFGCYMWICVLHVNVAALQHFSDNWAICRTLPPTPRLSSVFHCDVTITVERQTHFPLSNDPLKKSVHSHCYRRYNIDAIETILMWQGFKICNKTDIWLPLHLTWYKSTIAQLLSMSHRADDSSHHNEKTHLCSIIGKKTCPPVSMEIVYQNTINKTLH